MWQRPTGRRGGIQCPELETCDDGYADVCGSCNEDCSDTGSGPGVCGDGALCTEYEACDDGNIVPEDGCTAWCSETTGCKYAGCNSNGPRFPVSGEPQLGRIAGADPVVTDTQTGLMWQGCPAGLSGSDCSVGTAAEAVAWYDAVTYCTDLIWNDLDDWYLPDEYELQSIVDYSANGPAFDSAAFPATPNETFWASSYLEDGPYSVWYIDFNTGQVTAAGNTYRLRVRCVRRGVFFPVESRRFVRTGGSLPVVADTATGLVWQGCEAGLSGDSCQTGTSKQWTWQSARDYCDSLTWAGVSGWYLPDAKELRSIVDNRQSDPSVDTAVFPATTASDYWTSSADAGSTGNAWSVHFLYGTVRSNDQNTSYPARCVRRGP